MNYELNKIPQVRFPEFKEVWEVKRLEQIGQRITKKNTDFSVSLVLTNSAKKGIINQEDYFDKKIANSVNLNNYYIAEIDDFIYNPRISNNAPVGPLKRNNLEQGVMSPLYTVLRFNNGNLTFFEQYFETTFWHKYLKSIANYGARFDRMNITNESLLKLPLPFPTLPEQQKIAHFFSIVDKKISQLQDKKNALESYKKGMMQKIFAVGEKSITNESITNYELGNDELIEATTRNSSVVIPNYIRFKNENGKDFPDWEVKKLGELLINFKLGGNYTNSDTITNNPLIKMGNLSRGDISLKKIQYINNSEVIDEKDLVKYGDLFFNTRNTLELVGKVSIWRNELDKAYYNSNLMRIKFENNFYMNYWFNSIVGLQKLRQLATGTTSVAAIYTKDLLKIKVSLPSIQEQTKIANFLSKIDTKINAVNQQIEQSKTYKKGLLQKMFV